MILSFKTSPMPKKYLLLIIISLYSLLGHAQEEADNSFGGWHFVEISHKFGDSKWKGILYFEHENYQYKRLDCWFLRPGIRYDVLPWLRLGLSYDFLKVPDTYGHRIVPEVTGTIKEGRLTASLRLRYLHTWKPELHTEDNELRTRLLISYKIPDLKLMPYIANEIFTWGNTWRKSRHYVACAYDVTDFMQAEAFYMLTFSNKNPQHILGLGLNFAL